MLTFKSLCSAAVLLTIPLSAYSKDPASINTPQKLQMEQLIHDYLVDHPEVIIESITKLQNRQQAAAQDQKRAAVADISSTLKNSPNDPVLGNPNGDVTMVEFFDYRCGYCKRVFPDVQSLLKTDGNIRLVLKEFPILGPESVYASRAAQAVWLYQSDKYPAFHTAMMLNKGGLGAKKVQDLARTAGVDTQALLQHMNDPKVEAILAATAQQAEAMGFRGTPAFIIGNAAAPGAIPLTTMVAMVAAARKKNK